VQVGGRNGGEGGSCRLLLRVHVPNPAAVDVHNAVDFAAALHALVKEWTAYMNIIISVDAEAGCVSYETGRQVHHLQLQHTTSAVCASRGSSRRSRRSRCIVMRGK
jgi:hypothetical protein